MSAEAFASNWSYLKVELNNLERLLLAAVAKQKKDQKEGDRLLKTSADQAAQYWLQGLMSLDGAIGHDSPPPQRIGTKSLTYNQQLENRIQATQTAGRILALPALCDRLALTVYEKNLILLGIAPEIHRRYAKLYEYLNGGSSHLLTVDLSLRLLCRNDQEWRQARARIKPNAPLRAHALIDVLPNNDRPFLQQAIRLNVALVNYLLADQTTEADITALLSDKELGQAAALELSPEPETAALEELPLALDKAVIVEGPLWSEVPIGLRCFSDDDFAGHLVFPSQLKSALLTIAQEQKFGQQLDADWGFASWQGQHCPGQCALFVGPEGTGKASATGAIAQYVGQPLMQVDLTDNPDLVLLCQQLEAQSLPVLLVQNANIWLGRNAIVPQKLLQKFFRLRSQTGYLTIFTSNIALVIPHCWRQQIHQTLTFHQPPGRDRVKIWQQAFPPQIKLDAAIDWQAISKIPLTGGAIIQVARQAAMIALAEKSSSTAELVITAAHIEQGCQGTVFSRQRWGH